MPYLSGEVLYNLRNAFLHQGNPNIVSSEIKDIRCKVDEFNLVIGSTFSGDTSSVHYGANQQVIYRCCLTQKRNPFLFSFVLNAASYGIGLFV